MNISPKFAAFAAAPFALICLGVAVNGFLSMGELTDPEQVADARGYIGFWLFLAVIAVVSGVLSWWLMSAQQKDGGG
jgi:heme/copper-type cytochrome/quinol oxidase subunit 4